MQIKSRFLSTVFAPLLSLMAAWLLPGCQLSAATPVAATDNAPTLTMRSSFIIPPESVDGVTIAELSGLAWDEDEQLLYAVSDRGRLFHFRLTLEGNTITTVKPVFGTNLMDKDGKRLKGNRGDAEGLTLLNANNGKHGDTQLVVSFESKTRITRFTPEGTAIHDIDLPKPLRNPKNYLYPNASLESVTLHPRYGFITAPEHPLKGQPQNLHTLYSTKGQHWSFMAYPAPNSGISGLETLPDGNLLILERAWTAPLHPLTISLRYLDFHQCSRDGACMAQNLNVFSSRWIVDNFEGLTHLRNNQYLMVSDDGDSELLRTVLKLFTLSAP